MMCRNLSDIEERIGRLEELVRNKDHRVQILENVVTNLMILYEDHTRLMGRLCRQVKHLERRSPDRSDPEVVAILSSYMDLFENLTRLMDQLCLSVTGLDRRTRATQKHSVVDPTWEGPY